MVTPNVDCRWHCSHLRFVTRLYLEFGTRRTRVHSLFITHRNNYGVIDTGQVRSDSWWVHYARQLDCARTLLITVSPAQMPIVVTLRFISGDCVVECRVKHLGIAVSQNAQRAGHVRARIYGMQMRVHYRSAALRRS